jgi:hypothetical protein
MLQVFVFAYTRGMMDRMRGIESPRGRAEGSASGFMRYRN